MRKFLYLCLIFVCFYLFSFSFYSLSLASCPVPNRCTLNSDCEGCCDGYSHCTYTCNKSNDPSVCSWSVGNSCTKWCDNGPCLYYDNVSPPGCYKNQICCKGYIYDTQVVACDCGGGGGGSQPDPTPTPPPPTSTIQGYKVIYPGNAAASPASSQTVYLDGGSPNTNNPYYFVGTNVVGNHTVSVSVPSGYAVGYTLCYNATNCHGNPPTVGSSVNVNSPANGYTDLWWHYFLPCQISVGSITLNGLGDSRTITPSILTPPQVINLVGNISRISFTPSNSSALSFNPSTTSTSPFTTTVTATTGTGTYTYNAIATVSSNPSFTCQATGNVTIIPRSWWQVTNMDVVSGVTGGTGGRITSILPTASTYFNLRPGTSSSDTPGIPIYLRSINLGAGNVSETGWNVQTGVPQSYLSYNYNYFFSRVPAEVKNAWNNLTSPSLISGNISINSLTYFNNTNSYSFGGYRWILIQKNSSGVASLTINGTISVPSSSRYIFLVDGDLNINSNISVDTNGLIMFIVSGNINVNPNVTSISGIYLTNNQFNTGTRGQNQDTSLNITGSVVALNRLNLQRSLTNNDNPAEKFTLSPSFILQIPYNFLQRNFNWREVNPGM